MRHIMIIGVLLTTLSPCAMGGGSTPTTLYSRMPEAVWSGDTLRLSFRAVVNGKIRGCNGVTLQPTYATDCGDTLRFPAVTLLPASEIPYQKRREALGESPRTLLQRAGGNEINIVDYDHSIIYRGDSCSSGRIQIRQWETDCDERRLMAFDDVRVIEKPLPPAPEPEPEPEPVVVDTTDWETDRLLASVDAEVHLRFAVNASSIDTLLSGNRRELTLLDSTLMQVMGNLDRYDTRGIIIRGYASPEGDSIQNLRLSEQRAESMRVYLRERYGLADDRIRTYGMGEDWEGVREALSASDIPHRDEAIAIIDGYSVAQGRKTRLKTLHGGTVYNRILREIYPQVRRMETELRYKLLEKETAPTFPGNTNVPDQFAVPATGREDGENG